ncbi:MAG: hypothetical protein CSB44_10805 [Gammaproteobacteria bacterium]|nr:MAG: hypothetical protein CSB44_10805 [Gammaproteobacteria bacterium]
MSASADTDGDGFSNGDEIANDTDPCSAADLPADADGDKVSDLLDNDDDNDGIVDVADPFALDVSNGHSNNLPLSLTWENNSEGAGGLFNMGFTGLMLDGSNDWQQQFDAANITAGGAAGVFTIDAIDNGDPIGARNDQSNGFQFGLNTSASSPVFTVHTRVPLPLAGASFKGWQSIGLQIGKGDQDNYIKLVASAAGGSDGGIQFAREAGGSFNSLTFEAAAIRNASAVDLMLEVNPATGDVRAAYLVGSAAEGVSWQVLGITTDMPGDWLSGKTGLAVGLIATSVGATPFTGTWDFIEVLPGTLEQNTSVGGTGADTGSDAGSDTNNDTDPGTDANAVSGTDNGTHGGTGSNAGSDPNTGSSTDTGSGSDGGSGSDTVAGSGTGDGSMGDDATAVLIVVEAEDHDSKKDTATHAWRRVELAGARGGKAVKTTPDTGALKYDKAGSPHLGYKVSFPEAGEYRVWLRALGDTNAAGEGKSDSVHVGINGQLGSASAITGFPATWTWSSNRHRSSQTARILVPSAGMHGIDLWMREDGLTVDTIVFTRDTDFDPSLLDGTDGGSNDGSGNSGVDGDSNGADTTDVNGGNSNTDASDSTEENTGAVTDPVAIAAVIDGVGALEAEHWFANTGTSTHEWVTRSSATASGGVAVVTTPDSGVLKPGNAGTPMLSWRVHFDAPGNYRVWVRGSGDTDASGEGKSDSLHVGLNGHLSSARAMDDFPAGWHWRSHKRGGGVPLISVPSSGVHTVNVWMREDGMQFDKLVFVAAGSSWRPNGMGPAVAAWTGDSDAGGNTSGNTSGNTASVTGSVSADTNWRWAPISGNTRPQARHEAGGIAFEGRFYLIGGRGSRRTSVYDPATDKWSNLRNPPEQLHHFQPVLWGNRIWAIGALECCYPHESTNEKIYSYNPANDSWRVEGNMPAARLRGAMGAAVYNGKIYLVGGNTRGHDGGAVAWFDEFDPATGEWRRLPNAPHARDHVQVAVVDGQLIVAGGRRSTQPRVFANTVAAVDIYDFASGTWRQGRSLPNPRAGAMTVVVGGEVLIIGGESMAQGSAHRDVHGFDVSRNRWRRLKPLLEGRHSGGAAVLDGQVHVATGNRTRGGGAESASHEVLPLD